MKTDLNVSKLWPCGGSQSLQWNNMGGKQFPWRVMLQGEVRTISVWCQTKQQTNKQARIPDFPLDD